MAKIRIKAIRLTKDTESIKVAYEKDGRYYVRNGKDGFRRGEPINGDAKSVLATWGFREVVEAPYFYDGDEISQNIHRFEMTNSGTINYIDSI